MLVTQSLLLPLPLAEHHTVLLQEVHGAEEVPILTGWGRLRLAVHTPEP